MEPSPLLNERYMHECVNSVSVLMRNKSFIKKKHTSGYICNIRYAL